MPIRPNLPSGPDLYKLAAEIGTQRRSKDADDALQRLSEEHGIEQVVLWQSDVIYGLIQLLDEARPVEEVKDGKYQA